MNAKVIAQAYADGRAARNKVFVLGPFFLNHLPNGAFLCVSPICEHLLFFTMTGTRLDFMRDMRTRQRLLARQTKRRWSSAGRRQKNI